MTTAYFLAETQNAISKQEDHWNRTADIRIANWNAVIA